MRGVRIGVAFVWGCSAAEGGDTATDTDASTGAGSETAAMSETSMGASMSDTTGILTTSIGPDSDGEGSSEATATGPMPTDCAPIEAESAHCLTADGPTLHLVGLDSGSVCTLATLDQPMTATSLAWLDDAILGCRDPELTLQSADPVTGEVVDHDVTCQAVTRHPDGVVLLPSTASSPELYDSVDAIVGGTPTEVFGFDPTAARITVAGDQLYSSWHITQAVQVWDLPSSAYVMDVTLEDYDGGVAGLAVVGSTLAVLGPPEAPLLRLYDAASGALQDELELPDLAAPTGLACR